MSQNRLGGRQLGEGREGQGCSSSNFGLGRLGQIPKFLKEMRELLPGPTAWAPEGSVRTLSAQVVAVVAGGEEAGDNSPER